MNNAILCSLCLQLLSLLASAQLPEDPGPYPSGVSAVQFSHPLASNNNVTARIYYPAESEGTDTPPRLSDGPYPLVGFSHGYFAPPQFYSEICKHLASHGYVVASIGTEAGFIQFIERQAHDTHALLYWIDDQNITPGAFFEGVLDDSEWAVVGHSNGCIANMQILEWDDCIEIVVAMEPRLADLPALTAFTGSIFVIGGSNDIVNPIQNNAVPFYAEASSASRRTYTVIEGAGHNGSLDFPSAFNPLSHAEQQRLHKRIVTGALQTELHSREDSCYHLFGGGAAGEPLTSEADCYRPIFWALHDGTDITVGCAGTPSQRWAVAGSLSTSPFESPTWFPGIDRANARLFDKGLLNPTGLREMTTVLSPGTGGQSLYLRGGLFHGAGPEWSQLCTLTLP